MTASSTQHAVQITGLEKHYGSVHALRGVDLTIAKGEFFGLLGPNGAGKSTLINIMAGLTRANAGRVAVLGHDVVRAYRRSRRLLGVVPQELVYDPFFTVRETLRIQAGYFGLGRLNDAWLDELLCALKLEDKADANMRALSGGMKRRVLIAQALVHKPSVVVLDEPTAGVDVELRQSLWQFVRRLHENGHTIVLTTHYLEEAEQLCDRIAILDHGVVAAMDTKAGLLSRGVTRTVCLTIAEPAAQLPDLLAAKLKSREGNRLVFTLRKDVDSVVDILDALRAAGVQVVDLNMEDTDLEDIFIDLIHRNPLP